MPDEQSFGARLLLSALAGVWSCGLLLVACDSDSTSPEPATLVFRMGEEEHRNNAINHPLPTYPTSSLREGKEGVAVASIVAGRDGRVEFVELLEAPDEQIGRAVQGALEQWTFHPGRAPAGDSGGWDNVRIQSRMTFYFRIVDGAGVVLNPAEALRLKPADDMRNGGSEASVTAHEVEDLRGAYLDAEFGTLEPVFVDIREREEYQSGHYPGSVNIPVSELETRAPRELAPDRYVVLLCPEVTAGGWRFCTGMAQRIANSGFEHVGVLPHQR